MFDYQNYTPKPSMCQYLEIYTMLRSHKGKVTVKIDGIAASAASMVAMCCTAGSTTE